MFFVKLFCFVELIKWFFSTELLERKQTYFKVRVVTYVISYLGQHGKVFSNGCNIECSFKSAFFAYFASSCGFTKAEYLTEY